MPFVPKNWVDNVSVFNAAEGNRLEQGVASASGETRIKGSVRVFTSGPTGADPTLGDYCHWLTPFPTPGGMTVNGAEIMVNVAGGAGSTIALGLYSGPTTSWPPVRILDFGTVSCATTGVKSITLGTPFDFTGSMFWINTTSLDTTVQVAGIGQFPNPWIPIQTTVHADTRTASFAMKPYGGHMATCGTSPAVLNLGDINEGLDKGPRPTIRGQGLG